MNTELFQSCGHCWLFQIFWHMECSTFTASSFRIWNSSTGIPSPPLALFLVMLPKVLLTSHSGCQDVWPCLEECEWSYLHAYLGREDLFVQFCVFLTPLLNNFPYRQCFLTSSSDQLYRMIDFICFFLYRFLCFMNLLLCVGIYKQKDRRKLLTTNLIQHVNFLPTHIHFFEYYRNFFQIKSIEARLLLQMLLCLQSLLLTCLATSTHIWRLVSVAPSLTAVLTSPPYLHHAS